MDQNVVLQCVDLILFFVGAQNASFLLKKHFLKAGFVVSEPKRKLHWEL